MDSKNTYEQLVADFQQEIPSFRGFRDAIKLLGKKNVFLAGGAVRDAFLRPTLKVKDLDIFLTSEAFDYIYVYLKQHGDLLLNQFGTHRWYSYNDQGFYYDIIIIPKFYNGLWTCRNITDVLNQFDVTVNALAFDLYDGSFYDPQNGLLDIQQKILKAVRFDYPEIPVSDQIILSRNTVLWFRYRYYAQKLDLKLDNLTALWVENNSFRESSFAEFNTHFFNPSII